MCAHIPQQIGKLNKKVFKVNTVIVPKLKCKPLSVNKLKEMSRICGNLNKVEFNVNINLQSIRIFLTLFIY